MSDLSVERESPSGTVIVGLTPTLCRLIGVKLVMEVRRLYPALRLHIVMAYSGYVHEWLTSARLDLAVLHDARRAQHLAMEHIGDLALSLVSPAAAVKPGARRSVTLRDLEDLPLVLPTRHHGLRRTMDYAASQAGVALHVEYEVDALELMLALVQEGRAHTVLAAEVVAPLVASKAVVARRIAGPAVLTRLMLAQASNRPATAGTRVVERLLKALVREVVSS